MALPTNHEMNFMPPVSLKSVNISVVIGIIINIVTITVFISRLESRVANLENEVNQNSINQTDLRIIQTQLGFYADSIQDMKSDLKEIKAQVLE